MEGNTNRNKSPRTSQCPRGFHNRNVPVDNRNSIVRGREPGQPTPRSLFENVIQKTNLHQENRSLHFEHVHATV